METITSRRRLFNKVPEITIYFWVIKVLCTTVGETAADFLNVNLGLGLTGTSIVTGAVLAALLAVQLKSPRYVAGLYWATVAVVSIFGTLVTDNLTDSIGVPLQLSAVVFAVVLMAVFGAWYALEGTLSMHSIVTTRRELFYWLAVLVTFALGTATGDLMAEALSLGYFVTALIVAGVIGATAVAWKLGLNAVLAFWVAYILTRPLGASLGDMLAQGKDQGGLGLGTTVTSIVFLAAILALVVYLSVRKPDVVSDDLQPETAPDTQAKQRFNGLAQSIAVVVVLIVFAGGGYAWRKHDLNNGSLASTNTAVPGAQIGDLTQFRVITQDTLNLVQSGQQSAASDRITDLETAWDSAQGRLQARDKKRWTEIDDQIDTVLSSVRAKHPDTKAESQALTSLLATLG